MAEVKWIKITTNMFDNRKIKHIRKLPEGNNMVLIWIMLLTMAGRCNSGGFIFLTENIPYTPKMLADELDFDENVIRMALKVFEKFGMIYTDEDHLSIPGWSEYQNEEGLERIREYERERKAIAREKKSKSEKAPLGFSGGKNNVENFKSIYDKYEYIVQCQELYDCIMTWMEYKDERKPKTSNHYSSERGMGTLLNHFIEYTQKYGIDQVKSAVNDSISNNYQGVIWDRIGSTPSKNNVNHSVFDEWRKS